MASIESLASILEHLLLPQHAREAETQLKSYGTQAGFPTGLVQLISSTQLPLPVRQAGAVFFKNLVRQKWADEDGKHLFDQQDVSYIKSQILNIMIQLPAVLQTQIGEAVSIIADSDFPYHWEGLIDELVAKLSPNDYRQNKAILVVSHSIFKRWRPLIRSDELFSEIKLVLDKFAEPFLQLLENVDVKIGHDLAAQPTKESKEALIADFDSLLSLTQIYFDLNCQDIPEFFEDNMIKGMQIMHKYLAFGEQALNGIITDVDEDNEADLLIKTKTLIVELVSLYLSRYADVFEPLIQEFITTIWKQITVQVTKQPKFDLLCVKSLSFLSTVVKMPNYQTMFNNETAITEIIEKIILPNVYFRELDEEMFEDEPLAYVRLDVEGSDFDTRRKSATEFLRELKEVSPELVTNIVMRYVNQFLQKSNQEWRSIDIAIFLFSSLATKGSVTNKGVTSTNVLVDVVRFFSENVAGYLVGATSSSSIHPILRTDAIKYIYVFRNQLTKDQLLETFPLLFAHLQDSNPVVYTYTAITIDKLFSMTTFTEDHSPVFNKGDIQPYLHDLLSNLFQLIQSKPENLENEFLTRAVTRILSTADDLVDANLKSIVLQQLLAILKVLLQNPSNPRFSHYIFESLGLLAKYNTDGQIDIIAPALLEILGNDVQEFVPYTFQILAFLLEKLDDLKPLPDSYSQLIKPLLLPSVWEYRGNVPGITRLIIAILKHDPQNTFAANQLSLSALLGVFQKLIASKANDLYGFELLETILLHVPLNVLQPFINQIAILLLTRLQSSRTDKFVKRFFILLFSLSCVPLNDKLNSRTNGHVNGEFVVNFIDAAQPGVFGKIFTSFILPTSSSYANLQDKKILIVGLLKLLEAPQFKTTYPEQFTLGLSKLIENVSFLGGIQKNTNVAATSGLLGTSVSVEVREIDLESSTFGSSFSRIASIQQKPFDPIPDIKANDFNNMKHLVVNEIKKSWESALNGLPQETKNQLVALST